MQISRQIVPPPGYASREAGSFVAQMDDQTRRLIEDTRDLTPEALAWQPAPGMNSIGMLLAHIAIVEVYWMHVAAAGGTPSPSQEILGIGEDDDGIPLPAGAGPPATLRGKNLAFYDDLLARARQHTVALAQPLKDADLERQFKRRRRDGTEDTFNIRWVLYHVLEHFAGHYGQILLLRHQYQVARGPAPVAGA
jgi:uncharacterized damage-inducible protein DinB